MKTLLLAAAALVALPAAASAATVIDFNAGNVTAPGQLAYAPGFTQYNQGVTGAASVANVSFFGTSGIDFGPFGFNANSTPTGFLQTYSGLTDGSFTLSGLSLPAGTSFTLSFADVVRNAGTPFSFTITQGADLLGTYAADSVFTTNSLTFTSNGGSLTFSAVNGGGVDASAAIDNISVSAVPETATWAMMLAGFGMIGFAVRRKPSVRVTYA